MTRTVRSIPLGRQVRHLVRLQDDPVGVSDIPRRRIPFLTEVVTDGLYSGLLNCGPVGFDRFQMFLLDNCWTIELEATEEVSDGK